MAHKTAAVLDQVRLMLETQQMHSLVDAHLLELFLERRDEDAFAELVRRHGPLVMGVCRRALQNAHDAEDVFQATFLVFACKANSIRNRASLSSWLHGVAYRLSLKCRAAAARRNQHERPLLSGGPATQDDLCRRELRNVLDQELERLPEKQRAPLLLCYAEDKSQEEAARELGCGRGTLKRRLERGREVLRNRLARRGLALSAGAAAGLSQGDLLAAVAPGLAASTAKLATLMTASEAVAAMAVTAKAALLAEGILKSMVLGKVKAVAAAVLVLGLLGTSAGVVAHQALAQKPAEVLQAAQSQAREDTQSKQAEPLPIRLDPDGEPLPEEAIARFGSTRLKHSGMIGFLHFSPDGKTLVSQGDDCIRTWEVATGRLVRQFPGESADWRGASLSSDGRLIATTFFLGSTSGFHLWDVQSGEKVRTIVAGINSERRICLSGDGNTLASAGHPNMTQLELWDVRIGEKLRSWRTDAEASVVALVFTPDGKTLVTAQTDNTVRFWEVDSGRQLRQVSVAPSDRTKIAVSPNGALLAVLSERRVVINAGRSSLAMPNERDNRIRILDVDSGKELRHLAVSAKRDAFGRPQGFTALAFSPDSKAVLAGGIDDSLFVWNATTGEELRRYPRDFANLSLLGVSPDGSTVAAAVNRQAIRLFDLKKGQDLFRTTGHRAEVFEVALAGTGNLAVTNAREGAIVVWDMASGRELHRLDGYAGAISADDRTIVTQGADNTLGFWDIASGRELRKVAVEGKPFYGHALSPDGQTLAVRGHDNTIRLHDAVTGKQRWTLKGEDPWWGTIFTADGKHLIGWSGTHTAHVWDAATERELRRLPLNPAGPIPGQQVNPEGKFYITYRAQASADGRWIAYASRVLPKYEHPYVLIRDLATGKLVHRVDGLKDDVSALAFSADGKTFAWASGETPTIHLLELATGKERHRLANQGGRVVSLAFSADGKKLISGKDDTTVLVWDLTGKLAAGDSWGKPLSQAELGRSWADFSGDNAGQAYHAIRRLAASPSQAIPYLRARLQPARSVDEKQVVQWIADLDRADFKTRAKASSELEKLDQDVAALYRKALEGTLSLESKRRLEELLEKHANAWVNPNRERLRILRALEVLELAASPEARRVLDTLAQGPPTARLTMIAKAALERLTKGPARARP